VRTRYFTLYCTKSCRVHHHFRSAWELVDFSQIITQSVLYHQVLRFFQAGQNNPPRLIRINRVLPNGSTLAVKGEASIHGPYLVAWSVGSERRNLHL
jgi:hypothetical protein